MVLVFEILLVLAAVAITWFGLYVVYRLVTDES
ncbi:Potassium-transporting ATPase subunit F [Skermania piniformis]